MIFIQPEQGAVDTFLQDYPRDTPVVMLNLLGDIWENGEPDWQGVFSEPAAHLHLYGKREARTGRKMGHINTLAADVDSALEVSEALRALLAN